MPCRLHSKRVVVGSLACVVVWGTVHHQHHPHLPERPFAISPVMPTAISSNTGGTATWGSATWGGRARWE
jgi:hypothetical protein